VSTTGGVGSGAAGLGAADTAAGAAPGRRRAALGANFLPVVFSAQASAHSQCTQAGRNSLLIKELVKAAAAAGLAGCALSLPAAGGCAEPSSADMMVPVSESTVQVFTQRTFLAGSEAETASLLSVVDMHSDHALVRLLAGHDSSSDSRDLPSSSYSQPRPHTTTPTPSFARPLPHHPPSIRSSAAAVTF
jgi:hypothetical protein